MTNVLPFAPRGSASDVPAYDPSNPVHRSCWESMWRFAQAELARRPQDSIAATIDILDMVEGDTDLEDSDEDTAVDDSPCDDRWEGLPKC